MRGDTGIDFVFGDAGNDTVLGDADTDQVFGNQGDDLVRSGTGADFIIGGIGNDELWGNGANGAGDFDIDTFIFEGPFGDDTVYDFEIGFDGIQLIIDEDLDTVDTATDGSDVVITVAIDGFDEHTIRVVGVSELFNPETDISIA